MCLLPHWILTEQEGSRSYSLDLGIGRQCMAHEHQAMDNWPNKSQGWVDKQECIGDLYLFAIGPKGFCFLLQVVSEEGKVSSMHASCHVYSSEQKGKEGSGFKFRVRTAVLTRSTSYRTTGKNNKTHFTEKVCLPFNTQRRVEPKRKRKTFSHKLTWFQKPFIWTVHSQRATSPLAFVLPTALGTQNVLLPLDWLQGPKPEQALYPCADHYLPWGFWQVKRQSLPQALETVNVWQPCASQFLLRFLWTGHRCLKIIPLFLGILRQSSAVKNTCCSCRDLGSVTSTHIVANICNSGSGDVMPSSGLHGHCTQLVTSDACKASIHIK